MKYKIILIFIIIWMLGFLEALNRRNTTLILVRHAEKVKTDQTDPDLTTEGRARAQELVYMLQHVVIDGVFSTPYTRTQETVSPTAKFKNLPLNLYEPGTEKQFLTKILKKFTGKTILISGHFNTIPKMVNILLGEDRYQELPDHIYDNLFIVTMESLGHAEVMRLRFGKHTPQKRPGSERGRIYNKSP